MQDDSKTRTLPALVPEPVALELPRLLPPVVLELVAPVLLVGEPAPASEEVPVAPVEDRLPLEAAGAVDEVDVDPLVELDPVVELELPSVEVLELGVKLMEPNASSTASGGAGTLGRTLLRPVVVVVVVLPVEVAPALELAVGERLLVDVPPADDVEPLLPPVAVEVVLPVVEDVLPPVVAVQLAFPPLAPLVVP